jgi:hypothetical protein
VPRKPDEPCSKCGKLLWRGTGCRPVDQRICRECRTAGSGHAPAEYLATCIECHGQFTARVKTAKVCSVQCRRKRDTRHSAYAYYGKRPPADQPVPPPQALRAPQRTCEQCGGEYKIKNVQQRFCGLSCATKHRHQQTPVAARECEICSKPLPPHAGRRQRTCSRTCSTERQRRARPARETWPTSTVYFVNCAVCDQPFVARRKAQTRCPSAECRKVYTAQYMRARYSRYKPSAIDRVHNQRAILAGVTSERIDINYLCERDKWRCQLCRKPVKRENLKKYDPLGPSIDHIIPLTQPGTSHTYANTQLAHLLCNQRKGNRGGGEQLALFG